MSLRALGRQFVDVVKRVNTALNTDHEDKLKNAPLDDEHVEFK